MKSALLPPLVLAASLFCAPATLFAQAEIAAEGRAAAALGDFREAAALFAQAAEASSGRDVQDYQLLAADALLNAGAAADAEALLRRLPPSALTSDQAQLVGVLGARAKLARGDAEGALRLLPSQPNSPYAVTALAVRADALFALGDVVGGTTARALRDQLLQPGEQAANRELLWRSLNRSTLPQSLPNSVEPMVRSWIELAALVRAAAAAEAFESWAGRYSLHPAAARITGAALVGAAQRGQVFELVLASLKPDSSSEADLASAVANESDAVGGIALFLPLTGPLANAAQAVRNGAIAAMNQQGPTAPLLQIHDSESGIGNVLAAATVRSAVAVIGPLRKEEVSQLAGLAPSLPVVALNYPDAPVPANFLPFGLAPEDEARSAAAEALASNLRSALVVSLDGDWGERAANAFKQAFIAGGGAIADHGRIAANLNDYGPTLKPLLGITAAEARNRSLAEIGIAAELEAAPRSDVDVVFLALRGKQARLVMPQLRFLNGGTLPVFALAAATDAGLAEMGRVRVCDVPWRQDGNTLDTLRERLSTTNPRGPDTQRLFALGFDAYQLAIQRLQTATVADGSRLLSGLTGNLVLQQGSAQRQLACQPSKPLRADEGEPIRKPPAPKPVAASGAEASTPSNPSANAVRPTTNATSSSSGGSPATARGSSSSAAASTKPATSSAPKPSATAPVKPASPPAQAPAATSSTKPAPKPAASPAPVATAPGSTAVKAPLKGKAAAPAAVSQPIEAIPIKP